MFNTLDDDPAKWPENISDKQRCDNVERGPIIGESMNFPINDAKRKFSYFHYFRTMENGEKIRRTWLIYSASKDAIFCFCCRLFGTNNIPLRNGTSTWEGLSKKLNDHEIGRSHQDCMARWFDLRTRISNKKTIDDIELSIFQKERYFWREVMKRLIDIVIFLSERNLAFRGSIEKIGSSSNGNFFGTFELLAKYDNILTELLHRIQTKKTADHYLSPEIQNEIIQLLAAEILSINSGLLKNAKYYSIILDCTPDVSHEEQMSIVLRFVECNPKVGIHIREVFFGFLNVHDTTGKDLMESFLEKAHSLDLNIADMRAQSYDNGANMKGKNKGVQSKMLELNDRALYLPCSSHTLNLVISDAAKSSISALNFFGIVNSLCNIFFITMSLGYPS